MQILEYPSDDDSTPKFDGDKDLMNEHNWIFSTTLNELSKISVRLVAKFMN